jgi:hypothetical protein
MALRFIDRVSHYNSAGIGRKWSKSGIELEVPLVVGVTHRTSVVRIRGIG